MDTFIRVLVVLDGMTFLLFAVSHAGITVPLGVMTLAEPRIVPAMIVEGLCGLGFVLSAMALFTNREWAVPATLVAHVLALAGVLLGMAALAAGRGPRTVTNDVYHRVMLVVLLVGIIIQVILAWRQRLV